MIEPTLYVKAFISSRFQVPEPGLAVDVEQVFRGEVGFVPDERLGVGVCGLRFAVCGLRFAVCGLRLRVTAFP